MADKSCTRELKHLQGAFDQVQVAFEIDAHDAVAGLIGFPNKNKKNYKVHRRFFDDLYAYIMESGEISSFQLDAWEVAGQWRDYFSETYLDYTVGKTASFSKYRLESMWNKFKRIKQQREKIMSKEARGKDGMSNTARALMPPSLLAMKADRFGFITKLVKATKDMSDKVKQSYTAHENTMTKILEEYYNNAANFYADADKTKIMDGLHNLVDKKGRRYSILEVGVNTSGNTTYKVVFTDAPLIEDADRNLVPETKWLTGGTLGMTPEMYREAYISKYRDFLINDLLHGQTRDVKWHRGGLKGISKEHEALIAQEKLKRERRSYDIEAEMDIDSHDKNYLTQTHILKDTDGTTIWAGEIHYIMLKNKEGEGPEVYTAYLLSAVNDNGTYMDLSANSTESDKKMFTSITNSLQDGFYRADRHITSNNYQTTLPYKLDIGESGISMETEGLLNPDGSVNWDDYRAWQTDAIAAKNSTYYQMNKHNNFAHFEKMEGQPDDWMINKTTIGDGTTKYANLWDVIVQYRKVYENVANDIKKFDRMNINKRDRLEKTIYKKLIAKGLTPSEVRDWINENLFKLGGLDTSVWQPVDQVGNPTGDIVTPDSRFRTKGINYAPMMWRDEQFHDMLDKAYYEIQLKMEQAGDAKTRAVYKDLLQNFQDMRMETAKRGQGEGMQDQASTVHQEQRVTWTNPSTRRRDGLVHRDYLDSTFRNLHKQNVITTLMEQMVNVLETEKHMPKASIEYMVNRTKLAFGRTDTISRAWTPLGWKDVSNEKVAAWLNKLPSALRLGRTWDTDSAEKMWLQINGLLTMKFLGAAGAIGNRSQILNDAIIWGSEAYWKTRKEIKSRPDYWNGIVANTGVLNLLSMFNDIMLQGGKPDIKDYGYYPFSDTLMKLGTGADIPIPGPNARQWRKIVSAGKNSFITDGEKTTDATLLKMLLRSREEGTAEMIAYGRKVEGILNDYYKNGAVDISSLSAAEKLELQKKRGDYWNVMLTTKDENTEAVMMERMRTLYGDIDDFHLKQMVTWKLSWWFDSMAPNLFTFTEGEQEMRHETAVMAIYVAEKKGLLGTEGTEQDRMKSPVAVQIARDAVYGTMFGMSPVFLGEAFSGMGRMLGQYKSYPLFQMIRDWNTTRNFLDGGHSKVMRLLSVIPTLTPGIGKKYDLTDSDFDHEAAAFLRLLITRVASSTVVSLMHIWPLGARLLRKLEFSVGFGGTVGGAGLLRGLENPVIGTSMRIMLWTSLMFMGGFGDGGDDEDDLREDWYTRILFLTTPAIISMFARWGWKAGTSLLDNEEAPPYWD